MDSSCHVTFANDVSTHVVSFKDELVSMEENYSSIYPSSLPRTNDELTNAIFQVQNVLLDHRPLYLQISKNEFAALLLKALGPDKITSSVVSDLFAEVDTNDDGWLSAEELAQYMLMIEKRSSKDRYKFFYNRLVHSSILGSFAFLCASSLSISKNLFVRFYEDEQVFISVASELVCWLSLLGSFLFVWAALYSAILQMREIQSQPLSTKLLLVLANTMTIGQAINAAWLLGSIFYVAELWLAGGVCYLAGGVLAFPLLFKSALDELIQNQELVYKLHESFPEHNQPDHRRPSWMLDSSSVSSELSDVVSKKEENEVIPTTSQETSYTGLHKRLRSDNTLFVFKSFEVNDEPCHEPTTPKIRHQRTPTCPAEIFKRSSLAGTAETESLTDSECTAFNGEISPRSTVTILGKDVTIKELPKNKTHVHCYDVFVSFSHNGVNLDGPFRVIKRLSQSNLIDVESIRQFATRKSMSELRMTALCQQLRLPSLYIALSYAVGGLLFTISELSFLDFSSSSVHNVYLAGSTLYLCGSTGILYRAWLNVRDEWNLLQESRMALHAMTYPDATDTEAGLHTVLEMSTSTLLTETQSIKNE